MNLLPACPIAKTVNLNHQSINQLVNQSNTYLSKINQVAIDSNLTSHPVAASFCS